MNKICIVCKKNFIAREHKHKCCSDNCRKKYRKNKENKEYKNCKVCNNIFKSDGNKRYCSDKCIKINRKIYFQNRFRRNYKKNCYICNTIFIGNKIKKYCSTKCKHIASVKRNLKCAYKRKFNPQRMQRLKEMQKKLRIKNKEYNRERNRKYRIKNHKKILEKERIYRKKRMQNDIQYRLRKIIRDRVKNVIGHNYRSVKTLSLIGCTIPELKQYLQNKFKDGMSWENYGFKGWHIDHIIPCSAFDLTKLEEQEKCFHYTNLQPLWWWENFQKSDNIEIK